MHAPTREPAPDRDAGRFHTRGLVNVLEEDPELGGALNRDRLPVARDRARAAVMRISKGEWVEPEWPEQAVNGLGLLVLDGLLLRRVGLDGRRGAELLGVGDLLRPWQREDAAASVPRSSGWRVLADCRIAVLDVGFAGRIAAFPEIQGQVVARALRRSRQLAVNMAIVHQPRVNTRLHMLLWHLADRWGTMRPDGALLELPLTHALMAELVAAQRPTVSAALGSLERSGIVVPTGTGWVLHGEPPGELDALGPRISPPGTER
jgi:CRP/FNR family cyclic AMP-dependent transcriptional regulator